MDALVRTHRDAILRIAEAHGIRTIRVFGSRGRGKATPGSDLDLLVEPGSPLPFFFPGGLVADLEDLLGCRVDVVTPDGLYPGIRESVMREARAL
ncbi:MAG: nucleotidyltransferase family protein [Bacteroidota bacterium]